MAKGTRPQRSGAGKPEDSASRLPTLRYTARDKLRAAAPSLGFLRPVLALVDALDWLFAHAYAILGQKRELEFHIDLDQWVAVSEPTQFR